MEEKWDANCFSNLQMLLFLFIRDPSITHGLAWMFPGYDPKGKTKEINIMEAIILLSWDNYSN